MKKQKLKKIILGSTLAGMIAIVALVSSASTFKGALIPGGAKGKVPYLEITNLSNTLPSLISYNRQNVVKFKVTPRHANALISEFHFACTTSAQLNQFLIADDMWAAADVEIRDEAGVLFGRRVGHNCWDLYSGSSVVSRPALSLSEDTSKTFTVSMDTSHFRDQGVQTARASLGGITSTGTRVLNNRFEAVALKCGDAPSVNMGRVGVLNFNCDRLPVQGITLRRP